MKNKIIMFWAIVAIVIASVVTILVKPTKLGLDLVGGSRLVLEAQTTSNIAKITPDMMDSLQFAIENRVNALGVSETIVQKTGEKRLLIEIPNVSDPKQAREFLGETAELVFKRPGPVVNNVETWIDTDLTGNDVKKALVSTSGTAWAVSLEFNDKGARGQAQITGGGQGFAYDEAKKMVDLLNAGALPVPAKIIEENTVGPTLGADSIEKSKFAGMLGIGFVMIFMIMYYRVPGVIADIALIIYGLILFAIFKIVPVTLTLAGIAGFVLSIGMAVDANILIFERTKEELKQGRTLFTAINSGFDRAFTSIFDSNMTTIITCVILYLLGTSIVKGFALTLALGVVVSMFTAITVTKNFMHLLFGTGQLKHPSWFGLKESDIGQAYQATETKREKARFGVLD